MKNLESEFLPYNLALRMKALKFNEPCLAAFHTASNRLITEFEIMNTPSHCIGISTPTWRAAFKWFREKYNFHKYIEPIHKDGKIKYEYCVIDSSKDEKEFKEDNIVSTYEKAEIACLEELIEIVEQKQI